MPVDPRTPVLIGYGQVNQHDDHPGVEPVDLMVAAARAAADPRVLEAVDSVRIVNVLSWRYRDPGLLVAQRLRAKSATTRYTGIGGNVPQTLVNQACLDIQAGRADVVLIGGAETWRTRMRLRARGAKPDWTSQDESVPIAEGADEGVPMAGPAEIRIKLDRPAFVYPMFEQSVRIAAGESSDEHRHRIGELWSQFSAVAEANPHAWSRESLSAEAIWQPGPGNRMISWPYTKLMNSNNMVDQGAVADPHVRRAGHIPSDPFGALGFPLRRDRLTRHLRNRRTGGVQPVAGDQDCRAAGTGTGRGRYRRRQPDRRLLLLPVGGSGGRRRAGVTRRGPRPATDHHRGADVRRRTVEQLRHARHRHHGREARRDPGARGLVTANGGYLTKHSFGVYGTEPPAHEFRWEDVQSAVDREPTRTAVVEWSGIGTVESWTTPFNRSGTADKAFLAVRTPDDSRTLALIADPSEADATVREDIAGAKVQVHDDGTATLQ